MTVVAKTIGYVYVSEGRGWIAKCGGDQHPLATVDRAGHTWNSKTMTLLSRLALLYLEQEDFIDGFACSTVYAEDSAVRPEA